MKVDMDKVLLSCGKLYMTQKTLAEHFEMCANTVRARLAEMEALIGERYEETAIIRDGNVVLVNVMAFVDYETFRQRLLSKASAKYVPPFDPVAVRRSLGYGMFDEDANPRLMMA